MKVCIMTEIFSLMTTITVCANNPARFAHLPLSMVNFEPSRPNRRTAESGHLVMSRRVSPVSYKLTSFDVTCIEHSP